MRRRRLLRCGWLLLGAGSATFATRAFAQGDAVARVIETMERARSYKVRVQAVATLARLKDDRAAGAVARAATNDGHPVVRGFAVKMLGRNPWRGPDAARQVRVAVARALNDRDATVRRKASLALAELDRAGIAPAVALPARAKGGPMLIAVGNIGDRTGRASRGARDLMRSTLQALLARDGRVQIAATGAPGLTFVIDGTIARLDLTQAGADVEAVCGVQLIVSRPPRGIVTIASGEAVVQRPRAQFRPQLRARMEDEAVSNAVRSAHESLASFLRAQ